MISAERCSRTMLTLSCPSKRERILMEHPALPKPSNHIDPKRSKIAYCVFFVLIALVSFALLSPRFSSAETYTDIYKTLDERQNNVLSLAFGAALISSAISALPDDMGTSLSSEYADFYTGFAVVVASLILEKYLLTTIGFTFFTFIIPICCLLMVWARLASPYDSAGHKHRQMASKLFVFGLTISLMTPVSVFISRQIDESYRASVQQTIKTTEEATSTIEQTAKDTKEADREQEEEQEGMNPLAVVQKQFNNATAAVGGAVDAVGSFATGILPWAINQLRTYAELFAVMIVTSIIIPVLVPIIVYLLFKIMFLSSSDVTIPAPLVEALSSTGSALSGTAKKTLAKPTSAGTDTTPEAVQATLPTETEDDEDHSS